MNYNKLMTIANKQQNVTKQKPKFGSKALDAKHKEDEKKKAIEEKKKKMEAIRARVAANVNKVGASEKKEEQTKSFNVYDMTADPDAKYESEKKTNKLSEQQKDKLRQAFLEKKERLKQIDFECKSGIRARLSGEFVEDNWSDEESPSTKVTKPESIPNDGTNSKLKSEKSSSSSRHHKHKHKHSSEKSLSSASKSSSDKSHSSRFKEKSLGSTENSSSKPIKEKSHSLTDHASSIKQKSKSHNLTDHLSSKNREKAYNLVNHSKSVVTEKHSSSQKDKSKKKRKKDKSERDIKSVRASKSEPEKVVAPKPPPKPVVKRPANTGPPPMNFSDLLLKASKNDGKFGVDSPRVNKPKLKKQNHPRLMTAEERGYFTSEKDHEIRMKTKDQSGSESPDDSGARSAKAPAHNNRPILQGRPPVKDLKKTNGSAPKTGLDNRLNRKQPAHAISDDEDDSGKSRSSVGHKMGSKIMNTKSAPPAKPKTAVSHHLDKLKAAAQSSPAQVQRGSAPGADSGRGRPESGKQLVKSQGRNQSGRPGGKNGAAGQEGNPRKPAQPISAWDRIYGQIQQNNPKPVKKRQVIMSDSEEDEEDDLDGFIDNDGDDEDGFIDDGFDDMRAGGGHGSVSGFIKNMFGYDKRKYKDEDEDLSNMEVGYSAIEQEEKRSARIGLQEDLEDIRREEEELRLKKLKLKQKKMKMR